MKIALIVEGESDLEVIPMLIRTAFPGIFLLERRIMRRGNILSANKVRRYVEVDLRVKHPDVEKVLVCIDFECEENGEISKKTAELQRQLGQVVPQVKCCAVIHALEAWLLADPSAVAQFLEINACQIPPGASSHCRPKELLKEVFRRANKPFIPRISYPQITEMADPTRISAQNSSFQNFLSQLRDP